MRYYFLLLCLINLTGYTQHYEFAEANITFKNGSVLNGEARIDRKLKLKKDGGRDKIDFTQIEEVVFFVQIEKENKIDTLNYKSVLVKDKYKLMRVLYFSDKILIYGNSNLDKKGGGASPNMNSVAVGFHHSYGYVDFDVFNEYYCFFKDSSTIDMMYNNYSLKSFKKIAKKCFVNCSQLV